MLVAKEGKEMTDRDAQNKENIHYAVVSGGLLAALMTKKWS